MRVTITYAIEPVDGRYLVWRRIGDAEPVALAIGTSSRPRRFTSRYDAESAIESARRADVAAGTRLGVDVEVVIYR